MKKIGITVFGCEQEEAEVFQELAPRMGAVPFIIGQPVGSCDSLPAYGNRCVSVDHRTGVSEASLAALRKTGVRYISTRSIGMDHIDVKAAARMGIAVENTPYSPDGVADYTLMLLLMVLRNAQAIVSGARRLDFRLPPARGIELHDMTVGVVGAGHIGQAVIKRLQGFGCRILCCNRSRSTGCTSLKELLAKSDIVTLHTPLNDDTFHMIGPREIDSMKPGALLINTGRGALVDTGALVHALENGRLGGAALDVLEGEEGIFYADCSPQTVSHPFLQRLQQMPNVIITPHTAYYTRRALYDTVEKTILNCLDFEKKRTVGHSHSVRFIN